MISRDGGQAFRFSLHEMSTTILLDSLGWGSASARDLIFVRQLAKINIQKLERYLLEERMPNREAIEKFGEIKRNFEKLIAALDLNIEFKKRFNVKIVDQTWALSHSEELLSTPKIMNSIASRLKSLASSKIVAELRSADQPAWQEAVPEKLLKLCTGVPPEDIEFVFNQIPSKTLGIDRKGFRWIHARSFHSETSKNC